MISEKYQALKLKKRGFGPFFGYLPIIGGGKKSDFRAGVPR